MKSDLKITSVKKLDLIAKVVINKTTHLYLILDLLLERNTFKGYKIVLGKFI